MANAPKEIELLRRVAAAARWAIDANGDDAVGNDGRSRVGVNWIMAQGELAGALTALQEHYEIPNTFAEARQQAASIEQTLGRKVFVTPAAK